MTEPESERYDLRILRSLRRIIRSVELYSKKLAAEYKVTGPQLVCLLAIKEGGPLTATRLSREVHLSPSTIVGVVDRLEEKKLVQRQRDSKDRRRVHLSLTSQGEKLVESAPSPLQDRLAEALESVSELEIVSIALALERVVDLMEVRQVDASPILDTKANLSDS